MKKRILQVVVAIVITTIAVASLFIIDRFIVGAMEAEEKVNAYEEYHNMNPEKIDMKYDWYSGSGYIGGDYHYYPDSDLIFDGEYNELWRPYFDEKMEEIEASWDMNVLIEDYSVINYFDGSDVAVRYDDLFIYGVYNTQPVAEEERVETGAEIIMDMISQMGYNYNFCGVHIDYYDLNGVLRYSVALDKQTITKEKLMNSATIVSFEENLAIQEKWEAFCGQRVTFTSNLSDEVELDDIINVENEDRKAAYISALEKIVYQQTSPDDTPDEDWFYGDNKYAIYDVNLDGKEELLIVHDSTMSDSKLFIYEYDEETMELQKIFKEYPAITFYENGMIKAEASHNQTENEFWPYTLYRMDEETGTYTGFVCVSSAEEEKEVYEEHLADVKIIEILFNDLPIVRPESAG